MITLSKRVQKILPSATLSIGAKAKEMKKNGIDVVSFSAGEPDFDTPEFIKNAAVKALNAGFTKYTATSGILELKQAICDKFTRDNKLKYTPANILVSSGAKQSLYNLMLTLLNKNDEVLIPMPYWGSHAEMVGLAEGKCIFIPTNKNFKINAADIKKYRTAKTKILLLCSPSNPTGAVYSQKELEAIAEACLKYDLFVISDEIYEKLIYDQKHFSIAKIPGMQERTAVVNGVSKAYSMTGWRIGYFAAAEEIAKAATKIQDHTTSNLNSIAQKAALAALTGDQACVTEMVKAYQKRRDFVLQRLSQIQGIKLAKPDGAFYVFPDVSALYKKLKVKNSVEFCQKLLEEYHVAIIPGSAFGEDNCVRLSYVVSDADLKKGLDRLEKFCNSR